MKTCDHDCVGMIVRRENKVLLIERKKYPFGFAPPAGHVDGDKTYEIAASRELEEEVGLKALGLKLIFEGRKENPCRRIDGTWHYWKIYEVKTAGEISRSLDETKQAGWYTQDQIITFAEKTKKYLANEVSEDEWQKSPGLEVFWYENLAFILDE